MKIRAKIPPRHAEVKVPLKIGQYVPGSGIYIGQWEPTGFGVKLGKIFNVFAAPKDMPCWEGRPAVFTYENALKRLRGLKDWHGHDGTNYDTSEALVAALECGTYKGGWVVPPLELLCGENKYYQQVHPDNLYKYRDTGKLKDTFRLEAEAGNSLANFYLSSTMMDTNQGVMVARLQDGSSNWYARSIAEMSCRLVRLEPVS